jgi:hypothetical protein
MSRAFATGALLAAAACAGPNLHMDHMVRVVDYTDKEGVLVGTVATVNPDDTLNCGVETPTGTHISRRTCRFDLESSFLRQRTHDMLLSIRSSGASEYSRENGERSSAGIAR